MAVSEYNFVSAKDLMRNFPIGRDRLAKTVGKGAMRLVKYKGNYVYPLEAVFDYFYPGNDEVLVKMWNFSYEDIDQKWQSLRQRLKMFPICFFHLPEEKEHGIYRVYDCNRVLKFFVYIKGNECTLQAYNKDAVLDFDRFFQSKRTWI